MHSREYLLGVAKLMRERGQPIPIDMLNKADPKLANGTGAPAYLRITCQRRQGTIIDKHSVFCTSFTHRLEVQVTKQRFYHLVQVEQQHMRLSQRMHESKALARQFI